MRAMSAPEMMILSAAFQPPRHAIIFTGLPLLCCRHATIRFIITPLLLDDIFYGTEKKEPCRHDAAAAAAMPAAIRHAITITPYYYYC